MAEGTSRRTFPGRPGRSLLGAVLLTLAVTGLGAATATATPSASVPASTTAAVPVTAPGSAVPAQTAVASPAAAPVPAVLAAPSPPSPPTAPTPSTGAPGTPGVSVAVDPNLGKPSQTVSIIILLTVLSVAPAILVLCTSFTKIIVVLSLTRNALGTASIPPNQVLAGLALFLSLFIMAPVLSDVNSQGIQPYLKGDLGQSQAYDAGIKPLRTFMLKQTRPAELSTMVKLSNDEPPAKPGDVSTATLIPAFVLSELKSAFIIGFVVFVPFLVIDVVVSSALMSMGMMMLPPALISLPFKLLLFVMVDGWSLVVTSLVKSYQ